METRGAQYAPNVEDRRSKVIYYLLVGQRKAAARENFWHFRGNRDAEKSSHAA